MARKIDITGQRFGALVVIGHAPSVNGRTMVKCLCDCGKDTVVYASNLRRGLTTSCGCAASRAAMRRGKPSGKHIDITGQTYGHLTAVEFVRGDLWIWRCDCGKTKTIRASAVKSGQVISCGHVLSETALRKIVIDNVLEHYDGTSVSHLRSAITGHAKARRTNSTGHVGVRAIKTASGTKYKARLTLRGKEIALGTYDTIEEAIAARKKGEERYFAPIVEQYDNI